MSRNNDIHLVNFRINKKKSPPELIEFLEAQSNTSNSIRILLELAAEHFGMIDIATLTHQELNYRLTAIPVHQTQFVKNNIGPMEIIEPQLVSQENLLEADNTSAKTENIVSEDIEDTSINLETSGFEAFGFEDDD